MCRGDYETSQCSEPTYEIRRHGVACHDGDETDRARRERHHDSCRSRRPHPMQAVIGLQPDPEARSCALRSSHSGHQAVMRVALQEVISLEVAVGARNLWRNPLTRP
jgi:hypothetical protein